MKNDYVGKIINGPGNQLVNICDISLLNTSINSDKINLNINKDYFGEKILNETDVIDLIKKSTILFLVGNSIVDLAIKNKLAASTAVKKINKISFLMIYKF
tara:strand:- start:160 stop:462 length:303 start_codon:yes stop_codon:yes gene_type:complete